MVNDDPPENGAVAIDREHLRRQTMNDEALAHELMGLFMTQSAKLLDLIAREGAVSRRRDAAHTLKGAAVAIGAFAVAQQAEAVETAAAAPPDRLRQEVARLSAAVAAAHAAIAAIIGVATKDEGAAARG
jgi:HPt (histidine-containing phosphotransfer) domain-containing protein